MAGKVKYRWNNDKKGRLERVDRPQKTEYVHYLTRDSVKVRYGGKIADWAKTNTKILASACGFHVECNVGDEPFQGTHYDDEVTCPECLEVRGLELLKKLDYD